MASGRHGVLVFDPSVDAVAGATPLPPGRIDDESGGGLIAAPGTYYSRATETAGGGWSDIADQFHMEGTLVGTLTPEFSNSSDEEMLTGEDQWNDYTSDALPDPDVSVPSVSYTTPRTIDVDSLDFSAIGSGSDLTARLATVAALPACTAAGSGVGKTLTANAVGILTVDSVAAALNDLILVKNQVNPIDNGFYKVTTAGAVGVAFVLTRSTSMDATGAETTPGKTVAVTAGAVNTGLSFVLTGEQEIGVALSRYPYGRVRYKFVVSAGAGTIKDRRVIKAS